jgi:tryptophan synthase alpha subunit
MTHIVAGYPSMKECEEIALCMAKSGVSFIEIQIPFSDPIADGPTIMEANEKSLLNGTTPEDCFELIKRLKNKIKTPILIMSYFNIPFNYGVEKFCKKAKEIGVYGLIIPDIPIDEEKHDHYIEICRKHNLHPIQVISPITTTGRLKKLKKVASGFVYCISTLGTTGERKELTPKLQDYLEKVRKIIKLPLALGFGISSEDQVLEASKYADIVVIGSKMINLYKSGKIEAVKRFLDQILR